MNKLKNAVMQMDFPKFFRRFVVVALIAVLAGGLVAAIATRTQTAAGVSITETGENRQEGDIGIRENGDFEERGALDDFAISGASAGARIALGVFGLICVTAFLIYWLAVSAWLYQAAEKSDFHAFLWFLLALGGNLLAAALFIVVRSFLSARCADCGKWQDRKNRHCTACGAAMLDACPECEGICRKDRAYCPNCGRKLCETTDH